MEGKRRFAERNQAIGVVIQNTPVPMQWHYGISERGLIARFSKRHATCFSLIAFPAILFMLLFDVYLSHCLCQVDRIDLAFVILFRLT